MKCIFLNNNTAHCLANVHIILVTKCNNNFHNDNWLICAMVIAVNLPFSSYLKCTLDFFKSCNCNPKKSLPLLIKKRWFAQRFFKNNNTKVYIHFCAQSHLIYVATWKLLNGHIFYISFKKYGILLFSKHFFLRHEMKKECIFFVWRFTKQK